MNKDLIKNVLNALAKNVDKAVIASSNGIALANVFEIKAKYYLVGDKVLANFSAF